MFLVKMMSREISVSFGRNLLMKDRSCQEVPTNLFETAASF